MRGKDANTGRRYLLWLLPWLAPTVDAAAAESSQSAFIPESELRRALRSLFTPQAERLDRSDAALVLPMDSNSSLKSFTFVEHFETEIGYSQLAELSRSNGSLATRSELTSYFARAGFGADVYENLRASVLVGAGAFYSAATDYTIDGSPLGDARAQELAFSGWIGFSLRYRLNASTELRFGWELYDDVLLPETGFAGDVAQWRMVLENRW